MFRTLLAADAESDWDPYAKHPADDTWGLYQQNPRWWGTKAQILDPAYATESFVAGRPGTPGLRKITLTDDAVLDCWRVQRWGTALNPDADYATWLADKSTQNYVRRLPAVEAIMPSEEPRLMALVGGAQTSRGVVWLSDLEPKNGTAADKLRKAWTPGSQDRRTIIADHGTVLDAGGTPIPRPAGTCLASPGPPQTEFSDQGRIHAQGSTALFQSVGRGSNNNDTKGWEDINIGWEGQAHLRWMAANPMDSTGPIIAYANIEGASFDGFYCVIESPCLGLTLDVRYFNNCFGPSMWRLTGSDCQLWTHGGKGDWGGKNTDPKRKALVDLAGIEKSTLGAGFDWEEFLAALKAGRPMGAPEKQAGLYLTCSGAAGLEVSGSSSRAGLDIFGLTVEGRNQDAPSAGACIRQTGNAVNYWGGNVNYGMGKPADTGRGDKAVIDVSGGIASFWGTKMRRGAYTGALIARRGSAKVDTTACYEIPSYASITATNL